MKGSITFLTLCLVAVPIKVIGQDFSSSDIVIPYTQRQDIPGTCRDGQIIRLIPSNVDVLLRCKAGKFMPFGNIGITTFAAPPPFPQTNSIYLMTDATSTGTCSGGGSAYALCVWNGAAFVTPGGGGSGGAGTFIVTAGGSTVINSPATTYDTVAGTGVICTSTVDTSHVLHQQCSIDTAVVALRPTTVVTTGTTATISASFTWNQEATAATAVAYTLPTASVNDQHCVGNSYNGSAATTGILTINASASGQFIIFTDGTLSATGGNVTSGGTGGDLACFIGVDATHWKLTTPGGTWGKH